MGSTKSDMLFPVLFIHNGSQYMSTALAKHAKPVSRRCSGTRAVIVPREWRGSRSSKPSFVVQHAFSSPAEHPRSVLGLLPLRRHPQNRQLSNFWRKTRRLWRMQFYTNHRSPVNIHVSCIVHKHIAFGISLFSPFPLLPSIRPGYPILVCRLFAAPHNSMPIPATLLFGPRVYNDLGNLGNRAPPHPPLPTRTPTPGLYLNRRGSETHGFRCPAPRRNLVARRRHFTCFFIGRLSPLPKVCVWGGGGG